MHSVRLVAGAVVAAALFSTAAHAAPVYYSNDIVTDRAAFEAAAGVPLQEESFEGAVAAGPLIDYGAFTVGISTENLFRSNFGRGVTDGTYALGLSEDPDSTTVTFTFDDDINFFGLDVNDLNFASMSFMDDKGNVLANALLPDNGGDDGGPGFENLQFFGLTNMVSFSVVSLVFANDTNLTGTILLDRLQFGALTSEVPLPAALPLFIAGVAGLGALGRRRKKRA